MLQGIYNCKQTPQTVWINKAGFEKNIWNSVSEDFLIQLESPFLLFERDPPKLSLLSWRSHETNPWWLIFSSQPPRVGRIEKNILLYETVEGLALGRKLETWARQFRHFSCHRVNTEPMIQNTTVSHGKYRENTTMSHGKYSLWYKIKLSMFSKYHAIGKLWKIHQSSNYRKYSWVISNN